MEQTAYNKTTPNLVFEINEIDRVAVGGAGIKEEYVGTLVDTSSTPYTKKENYRVQVKGFESDWVIVPNTVRATIINEEGGGSSMRQIYIDLTEHIIETFNEAQRHNNEYYEVQVSQEIQDQVKDAVDALHAGEAVQVYFKFAPVGSTHEELLPVTLIDWDEDPSSCGLGAQMDVLNNVGSTSMALISIHVSGDLYVSGYSELTLNMNQGEE